MTTQHLKTMLQDIINDRPEQAQAAMHEYFIAKSRELTESSAGVAPERGQSLKESFVDGDFSNGTLSNVSKLPKTIMSNLDCRNNKIDSLRGIQKYVKTIKGTADFTNNPIKSHVLGLLEIDGLKSVMLDNKKVAAIINKHLKGDKDVIACQEELIDAGFEDFAQL